MTYNLERRYLSEPFSLLVVTSLDVYATQVS
jgi:hypothetical protein